MNNQSVPPAACQAACTPTLLEFVAEIDRLIDAQKPSTHLWNYCVWNRKDVLRAAVRHDMSVRKVLAHHELMPGRVAANTETLLADLLACDENAKLHALVDANVIARCDAQDRADRLTAALEAFVSFTSKGTQSSDEDELIAQARAALHSAQS